MRLVDPDVLDDHLYEQDWGEDPKPQLKDGRTRKTARALWWEAEGRREILIQGYAKGVPVKQLAKDLGIPVGSICGEAYRMGLVHLFADYNLRMERLNKARSSKKKEKKRAA